ncbi:alpha/beta hydrolase family protein [Allofustis seminis]|uniref:alpha/beta hydrolase family protein n=1 Tax=Allofustis seminis TaxID=166939 RepID=UPI000365EDC1|nr:S9 family peptidase [Allofustis seminis]
MEKMTNETLYNLKNVSQPLSAGNFIFYLETQMNKNKNEYETTLWGSDKKTQQRVKFGTDSKKYAALKVMPNQKQLSFLALDEETNKMQVFTQPLSGGSAAPYTNEKGGVTQYFWTKENELIYQTTVPEPEKDESEKDWPTATHNEKMVHKIDGGTFLKEKQTISIKKLSAPCEEAAVVLETSEDYQFIEMSAAGDILYLAGPKNLEDEWEYGTRLYIFKMGSDGMLPLTEDLPEGIFFDMSKSPNEKYQVVIGNDFAYHFVTQNEVYLLTDSKTLIPLTAELDADLGDSIVGDFQQNLSSPIIQWQDDEHFFFSTTEQGTIKIYMADLEGNIELVLDCGLHITDWNVAADENKIYLTYSTPIIPSRLAFYDLTTKEWSDLYDPNEEVLQNMPLSDPEDFIFEGARQWKIQGWYVAPIEKVSQHPAILYIHGGPQVCYGETFFHEMQALASEGYGVIMINPRGGSSYGQSFVSAILGDYGNEDYQDLMRGVDAILEAHPEIDTDHVYVTGGSYGGFMTNWIVTHTDRFKAAVTQRSISNWISFYGTSDVGPHFVEHQLLEDLTGLDKLWAMSPLAHQENMTTPLLVIHSQNDLRCPLEQGEQMYRAALKQGVKTKLMTFPSSSHGLSREGIPNLRQERLQAIVQWFKDHQ